MSRCLLTKSYLGRVSKAGKKALTRDAFVHRAQRAGTGCAFASTLTSICCLRRLVAEAAVGLRSLSSSSTEHVDAEPVGVLLHLLSDENARSTSPELQTPNVTKSLYRSVKFRGHLNRLTPDVMTSLIRLFGSLSVLSELSEPPPAIDSDSFDVCAHHPLASHLYRRSPSGTREHWSFVLAVAKDKQLLGQTLSATDSYWLMRAALEDLRRLLSQPSRDDKDVARCTARARNYYLLVKPAHHDWFVHRVYLEGLLAHGGPQAPDEVVYRLGNILAWNKGLHWHLRGLLWRILALPRDAVSPVMKAHFLRMLREKVSKARDVLPIFFPSSNEGNYEHGDDHYEGRQETYDALAIRNYLVDILFSPNPGTHSALRYLREVYPWALFETRAALRAFNDGTYATSDEEDRAAWNNLALLSLSYTATRTGKDLETAGLAPGQSIDGVHSQGQVLGWTVICALAALSSELHGRSRASKRISVVSAEDVQDMARTLWVLWRKEESWRAGAVTRSMALICSTTTSFMALVSVSGDARLAGALVRHISNAVNHPARLGGEAVDRRMLETFAVHFVVMSAAAGIGGSPRNSWEEVLFALRSMKLIPDGENEDAWTNAIANGALREYVRLDSAVAHKLYKSAAKFGLSVDGATVLAIGKGLASHGFLESAFDCLRDEHLPPSSAQQLLDSLLSNTLRFRRQYFDRDLAQAFVRAFTETNILPTNGFALERVLHTCLRAGHLKETFEVYQTVNKSKPSLLRSRFLAQFVSTLVSHRCYRHLGRIIKNEWRGRPNRSSLAILQSPQFHYVRRLLSYSNETSSRDVARFLPFSIYTWPLLKDHIPFHPRLALLDKKVLSLKLSSSLRNRDEMDEKSLERAVRMLVSVGRVTSALKLLDRFSSVISTKLGNIILGASFRPKRSRRQHRQVRHASTRLAQLVQKRGFVPDRVTLNLVMKAILRWQTIASKETLRALFDRFVVSGYPGPEVSATSSSPLSKYASTLPSPPERGPFGTFRSPAQDTLPVNLKSFPSHVSFDHHTKPLYKMFAKAFRARGDYEGARRVMDVLRRLKARVAYERVRREQLRQTGRIKVRSRDLNLRRVERSKTVKDREESKSSES